jgi:hypothetical protein
MARPRVENRLVDMDNADVKRRVTRWFGILSGMYRITAKPAAPTRSNEANGYYFSEVAGAYAEWLTENNPRKYGPEEAHYMLAAEVIGVPIYHPDRPGRQIGTFVPPTHTMSVEEFMDYVGRARDWLLTELNIPTNDPTRDPRERRKHNQRRPVPAESKV